FYRLQRAGGVASFLGGGIRDRRLVECAAGDRFERDAELLVGALRRCDADLLVRLRLARLGERDRGADATRRRRRDVLERGHHPVDRRKRASIIGPARHERREVSLPLADAATATIEELEPALAAALRVIGVERFV